MKLQLINAPLDEGYMLSLRTGLYPPLNLATLSSYVKERNSNIDVEVIDGEVMDWYILLSKIDADVVGISSNVMTYKSALSIAKIASGRDAKVIMGGPYPSSMPEKVLENNDFVDAVVNGDGEEAILKYMNGEKYDDIPNLVYRNSGQIKCNPTKKTPISDLSIPDYSGLDLERYFQNFRERYSVYKPFNASLATFSRKGCKWRDTSNGGCVFCMIPHYGVSAKSPQQLWSEINHYNKEFGVDYIWEVCDTFTEDDEWIKDFIRTRPSNLDVSFQIYGRANHITERMAAQLKELNVFEVLVGIESGDNNVLRNANKGQKVSQSIRAIEALSKQNIRTIISLVLGLPGETPETLQKTLDLAYRLSQYDTIVETSTSIMLPIPGSNAFSQLVFDPKYKSKYDSDILNLEELKIDWLSQFTNVTVDDCNEVLNEIMAFFPLNNSFSQKELLSSPQC